MHDIEPRSPFDEMLMETGPPAVFTIDSKGCIGLDEWRTREHYSRVQGIPPREDCHCLYRDRATGFVQYVFVTSRDLCAAHPLQDITLYPDQATALSRLAALGTPPISTDPL